MHKLVIHKLGPIDHCELEINDFMTFTGFQASGKSTIAKAIYYFRTIKDDIPRMVAEQIIKSSMFGNNTEEQQKSLMKDLEVLLREKFLRTFGSSWAMSNDMYIEYQYTNDCFVRVCLKEDQYYSAPNYIWIETSYSIKRYIYNIKLNELGEDENYLLKLQVELQQLFDDACSVIYIPAGRSMITLLSQQLNYIYATMDDASKRALDICTKDYLERILRLKPLFTDGLMGLSNITLNNLKVDRKYITAADNLITKIMKGKYRYTEGEEQIVLDNGRYVKLNFASSGQQESVWICNLLFYYLIDNGKKLFIIEEPESHLFPESQKYISELIALINNCGHSVVLTTHSPYVLGTLNNLLYVHSMPEKYRDKAEKVIPHEEWLDYSKFSAWFVQDGSIEMCMDDEIFMIQNERIDEISNVINMEFDELINIQSTEE